MLNSVRAPRPTGIADAKGSDRAPVGAVSYGPRTAEFQRSGGISTHRGVLDDLDLWAEFSFLPALQTVRYRHTNVRSSSPVLRMIAKDLINGLEHLRRDARSDLVAMHGTDLANEHSELRFFRKTDYLWYSKDFTNQIESRIRAVFRESPLA